LLGKLDEDTSVDGGVSVSLVKFCDFILVIKLN
jgi:hypothetical protein